MSQETELKLTLPRAALTRFRHHPLVSAAEVCAPTCTLDNIYYDTPALDLKTHKIALRTRRQGKQWLQTVKCASLSTGGLSQRPEWETPYTGQFDFDPIDQTEIAEILTHHRNQLAPVLQTRFRRETRRYTPRAGVSILLMLDTGHIKAAGKTAPICELELELETGTATDLLELAETLVHDLPLQPADQSKAERGYRLFLDLPPAPVYAEPSALLPHLTPLDAFRQQAFACLRHWQANAEMLATALPRPHPQGTPAVYSDIAGQIHLALQRLQALLTLFSPVLSPSFIALWIPRLKTLALPFEQTDNYRHIQKELLSPLALSDFFHQEPTLPLLIKEVEKQHIQAGINTARCNHEYEQGATRLAFLTALHRLPSAVALSSPSLKHFAMTQLSQQRKTAQLEFQAVITTHPARLDALQNSLNQLDHNMAFFAPLLPAKKSARYLSKLTPALDIFRAFNSLHQARILFEQWRKNHAALRIPTAFFLGWYGSHHAYQYPHLLKQIQHFIEAKTPWKKT